MALKTFYAIVTERDASPEWLAKYGGGEPRGPLMFETYLDEASADEDAVRERMPDFSRYGWVRVAQITVDLPEE